MTRKTPRSRALIDFEILTFNLALISLLESGESNLRRDVSKNETLLYQMGVHFKR